MSVGPDRITPICIFQDDFYGYEEKKMPSNEKWELMEDLREKFRSIFSPKDPRK